MAQLLSIYSTISQPILVSDNYEEIEYHKITFIEHFIEFKEGLILSESIPLRFKLNLKYKNVKEFKFSTRNKAIRQC